MNELVIIVILFFLMKLFKIIDIDYSILALAFLLIYMGTCGKITENFDPNPSEITTYENQTLVVKNLRVMQDAKVYGSLSNKGRAYFESRVDFGTDVRYGNNKWIMHAPNDNIMRIAPIEADWGKWDKGLSLKPDGDAVVSKDVIVANDVVLDGSNKWIIHSPNNGGRKTLYIAPHGPTGWNWNAQTTFEDNGKLGLSDDITMKLGKKVQFTGQGENAADGASIVTNTDGTLHLSGTKLLYLLNMNGVRVGDDWQGNGNLSVSGDINVGRKVTAEGNISTVQNVYANDSVNAMTVNSSRINAADVMNVGGVMKFEKFAYKRNMVVGFYTDYADIRRPLYYGVNYAMREQWKDAVRNSPDVLKTMYGDYPITGYPWDLRSLPPKIIELQPNFKLDIVLNNNDKISLYDPNGTTYETSAPPINHGNNIAWLFIRDGDKQ